MEVCEPIAKVSGSPLAELPKDLYIPPDAMMVILEVFEGPLDLLLYLIKKHNIDILDIPVADITLQYTKYVDLMRMHNLELAADYLEMAAILTEIKSRMLLPKPTVSDEVEVDPRVELVRRLQEYEQIKRAAVNIDCAPRLERDFLVADLGAAAEIPKPQPEIALSELLGAIQDVLKRASLQAMHTVTGENLSVRDKMSYIMQKLHKDSFTEFATLFDATEGRLGVVVTFIAILELAKESLLEIVQSESFAPIYVRLMT